ncbi:MAG TPA: hypothetical protein VH092_03010 [Urbifossiella sp.]|nr:hypothetical protein [Urbifossiella sp.]
MIRYFSDENGFPRVEVIDGHPNIGSFLEQDIQSSSLGCQEYMSAAEDVEVGRLPEWSGTGNAHTVTIRPSGVSIENVWDEGLDVAEMSIPQFKQCLGSWLRCISQTSGS